MDIVLCLDHGEAGTGACETCGRAVCRRCLEEAESPTEFECPDCGEYGVAMHDEDYGEPGDDL